MEAGCPADLLATRHLPRLAHSTSRHPLHAPNPGPGLLDVQRRAGYVLLHVHRANPTLIAPHVKTLLSLVGRREVGGKRQALSHKSITRQVFSVLQDGRYDEALAGMVFAKAVDTFLVADNEIAGRARALDCTYRIALQYPGLQPEVLALALELPDSAPPGLLSLRRRIVERLAR